MAILTRHPTPEVPEVSGDLASIWHRIQGCLLPGVEESLEEVLTQRLRRLVSVLEVVRVEQEPVCNPPQQHRGRPRKDRGPIARAFVARPSTTCPTPIC